MHFHSCDRVISIDYIHCCPNSGLHGIDAMASTGGASKFASSDALWRAPAGERAIPRISPVVLSVRRTTNFEYATSIMKHPDPIGKGLASDVVLEAAGPDCIVPGRQKPIRILGLKVWPVENPKWSLKFLEPIGREAKTFLKMMDRAFDLMQAPFNDR
ncbi:hypothetical protein KP509_20G059800 [Ceratopteris richardii]|uniref:Uncharacterized protein n=1 Tax=Ceratopteris richardii TaxID=49495 RepID=A0A8T2SJL6_CERRI|nr:hypothetical protein KP509_20G059800 [Ceratopteris richardii]